MFGASRVPLLVLNVVYPLVPEEIREFCASKRAVLVVEEGNPAYIEDAVNVELRRADIQTKVFGKGALPQAGEYSSDVLLEGLAAFLQAAKPKAFDADALAGKARALIAHKPKAAAALGALPPRPPAFCTGCPERPVFSAIKLMQRELGPTHISADIGCHSFATFAPFSLGNSILGYGMSLASAAAVAPNMARRPIAVMGDGGFWHNGLITGVASNLFNKGDGVLIVMQNGYASATGQQYIPSSTTSRDGPTPGIDIEQTLRMMGVKWLRTVRTYSVAKMTTTLKEAMRTAEKGLKVIIADGECQLARQRRVRAEDAEKLKRGLRVTRARYGVDDEICTGDHSCIRLSGCPSLTVKPSPDPLRSDPVATVVEILRRLRAVRRGGARGGAVPLVLPRRNHPQRDLARPRRASHPPARDRVAISCQRHSVHSPAATDTVIPGRERTRNPERSPLDSGPGPSGRPGMTPVKLLIAALGGEGGGVLTQWIVSAAAEAGFPVQSTSIPGVAQRTGATTYYIEILPVPAKELGRQAAGAGAHARRRRHRRGGDQRVVGSRPHGGQRLHHARAHACHRLVEPLLCHGREDRHGRRPLRSGQAHQGRPGARARCAADRHGAAGAGMQARSSTP